MAVLVLTMFDEDALVEGALAAGARGYLLKGAESTEIERAIRTVASGDTARQPLDRRSTCWARVALGSGQHVAGAHAA